MDVRLLYFDGCTNWVMAEERLRSALAEVGHGDEPILRVRVETIEDASGTEQPALACRVFTTPDGRDGSPTVAQLVGVLS